MVGNVVNIKVCSPLKLHSGLTGKNPAIYHYSYNFPFEGNVLTFNPGWDENGKNIDHLDYRHKND